MTIKAGDNKIYTLKVYGSTLEKVYQWLTEKRDVISEEYHRDEIYCEEYRMAKAEEMKEIDIAFEELGYYLLHPPH